MVYIRKSDLRILSVSELDKAMQRVKGVFLRLYPEYSRLIEIQSKIGCRIEEVFEPWRWSFGNYSDVIFEPQKGNALRTFRVSDFASSEKDFLIKAILDMERLPRNQYERGFSMAVKEVGLYRSSSTRIYHPSSHTFRHLLMKQKYEENTDISEVARYFGERETRNVMYYLTSNFHLLTGDGENQAQS